MFPKMVFVERPIIPSVGNDAVLGGWLSRQVGGLSRAGDGWQDGLDGDFAVLVAFRESL